MSAGTLFGIGAVLFFIGGLGMVIVGLDVFGAWRLREKQPDEEDYLEDQSYGQAITDPLRHKH